MIERDDIVVAVVAAAGGGGLTGRTRLQKTVYLLDQLGLNSGFQYDYHHYGPYSRNLDNATADAKALNLLKEEYGRRKSDGAIYSIFHAKNDPSPVAYGGIAPEQAKELVQRFASTDVTVLELAATIVWLWRREGYERDWDREIKKRKGMKVQSGRLERAIELLDAIGLKPPHPVVP